MSENVAITTIEIYEAEGPGLSGIPGSGFTAVWPQGHRLANVVRRAATGGDWAGRDTVTLRVKLADGEREFVFTARELA